MEPVALAVDKLKSFAKSSQYFVEDIIHRCDNSACRNPVLCSFPSNRKIYGM